VERADLVPTEGDAAGLQDRLAQLEAAQATLEAEITAFHAEYLRQVGIWVAQLNDVEARILRIVAERSQAPRDVRAAEEAEEESRRTAAEVKAIPKKGPIPTDELKKLFRDAAKVMHPDIASEGVRPHAEAFMKRLNQAYKAGDADGIRDLVQQWQASPFALDEEAARRAGDARRLRTLQAAVARAEERLRVTRASRLSQLMEQTFAASAAGTDLLAQMRIDAEAALIDARQRLTVLEKG
jgi:hypothetical protein